MHRCSSSYAQTRSAEPEVTFCLASSGEMRIGSVMFHSHLLNVYTMRPSVRPQLHPKGYHYGDDYIILEVFHKLFFLGSANGELLRQTAVSNITADLAYKVLGLLDIPRLAEEEGEISHLASP